MELETINIIKIISKIQTAMAKIIKLVFVEMHKEN
jgi:hypothetical protein